MVLVPLDRGESPGNRPSQLSWLRLAVEATRKAGFGMASACAGEALFSRDSGVTAELLRLSDGRLYTERERRESGRA